MNLQDRSWRTWLNLVVFWVFVNAAAGVLVYATVVLLVGAALDLTLTTSLQTLILFASPLAGGLGGAVAGFGQWSALRHRLPGSESWALATIVGWLLGVMMVAAVFSWLLPDGLGYFTLLSPFAVGGAIAGLLQARILQKWVAGQGWWVLASASGWMLGWIVALGTRALYLPGTGQTPGLTLLLLGFIHGAIIGLQSGTALAILLMSESAFGLGGILRDE